MIGRKKHDDDLNMPGPLRRNGWLLLLVVVSLVLAPLINQMLRQYRAIVLDVKDSEMLVAHEKRAPEWVRAIDVEPGAVVEKTSLSWSPSPVGATEDDRPLFDLYHRYIREYEGVIEEIRQPTRPGGASVAVVQTDAGQEILVPLWGQHLETSAPGRRLRKRHGEWEPELVEPQAPAGGAQFLKPQAPQGAPDPDSSTP